MTEVNGKAKSWRLEAMIFFVFFCFFGFFLKNAERTVSTCKGEIKSKPTQKEPPTYPTKKTHNQQTHQKADLEILRFRWREWGFLLPHWPLADKCLDLWLSESIRCSEWKKHYVYPSSFCRLNLLLGSLPSKALSTNLFIKSHF